MYTSLIKEILCFLNQVWGNRIRNMLICHLLYILLHLKLFIMIFEALHLTLLVLTSTTMLILQILTWIYYLKLKLEALRAFKLFLTFVKTQVHTTIKALQFDYRGEFRPFTKYLFELGMSHIITCIHTSHQKGIVERKHIHIIYMGLTMLSHSPILQNSGSITLSHFFT